MRAPRILSSLAFRIVLAYVTLFAISAGALIAFTYWNTERAIIAGTDQVIEAETTGLIEQYQRLGLNGLQSAVLTRVRNSQGLYLLVNRFRYPVVGNLDAWPEVEMRPGYFVEFDYERTSGGTTQVRRARGRAFQLKGGFLLLVARDVHERYETERLFTTTLPWTAALMLTLGLIGGALISRNFLARLDTINRAAREIMAGDLSRRVPAREPGDEFDALSQNLNRMLDRIERLMAGMREVTDSIAHDLRSPLNRLRNRLEDTLHDLPLESPEAIKIEGAVSETDRLIGTFNALLLIAEAEAGVAREAMEPIELSAIVDGIAELYEPVAEEKGISLSIAPSGRIMVKGNKSLITQALANLLDNAIKYTPESGKVRVELRDTPQGAALSVADSGPGIPAGDRARVIERFVRLEASRNSPGMGLGLSLVAAVARMHEARLELADNMPGLKATIHFPPYARPRAEVA
ncbi:MAG: HAMP domain-containing protein [Alphaproteobacteria bacterium]|nr:HAMP domain-containing protein [Alphaproteobacteria bacterium]